MVGFPIPEDVIESPQFLDVLRECVHAWSVSLFDPEAGGFRQNADIGVNIMSSTDMVWMRYATHDADPGAPDREKLIAYIEGAQDPETGMVRHAAGRAGQNHCDAHAFWQTVRALNILGGRLKHFPHHLRPLVTPEGLEAWFDGIDWDSRAHSNHHEVLGIVPLLVSLNDPEWGRVFYAKIVEQQNPKTGSWPRPHTNISRTYAYTVIHVASDMLPPYPERMIDTVLDLQEPSGFWDDDPPGFHTMDCAFLLARVPSRIGYREQDARDALGRLSHALRATFARRQVDFYAQNPHKMLALTHTFGLLQETFPEEYPSNPSYRFNWEDTRVYVCDVIRH